jgi:hypothetical protein
MQMIVQNSFSNQCVCTPIMAGDDKCKEGASAEHGFSLWPVGAFGGMALITCVVLIR